MTGTSTRPATTDGNAPSIPAATTIASAPASRNWCSGASSRCRPATPTSSARTTRQPISRATHAASSALGASDAPAVSSPTTPPESGGGVAPACVTSTVPPLGATATCANSVSSKAATSAEARLTRTRPLGTRSSSPRTAATVRCGGLPAAYTTSGTPLRACRCASTCTGRVPSTAASPANGSGSATDDRQLDNALVEAARTIPARIDLNRGKAELQQCRLDTCCQAFGSHARQFVRCDFHAGSIGEVAHTQLAEAELTQR